MKKSDLKNGQVFKFSTPENQEDFRIAEVSFMESIRMFTIQFNGGLFTFKTFSGMKGKLNKMTEKWNLIKFEEALEQ